MRGLSACIALLALTLTGAATASPVIVASTDFATGLDGWTSDDLNGGSITHRTSNGQASDGFLEMADLAAQFPMTAVAPAEYLAFGDYDELTLSFWHRIIDFGGHSANSSPRVFLRSPTSSARFLFPQVAQASWSDWSVSLTDEAGWIIDTGSWADLQENADFLGINVDVTSGFDVSGLDTVVLIGTTAASIPAPAAALLLMPGLAAFRWQARR